MWILPKSHTDLFALDTGALILDSEEQSETFAQSLTLRGKDMLARTWLRRLKLDSWIQHLSGRTLKLSHMHLFTERYISSLEVIPVNRSATLANGLDKTTQDTSGHTLQMEFASCDLECASSRTSPVTSRLDSAQSSAIWKRLVTAARLESSQREKLARLTLESESSYLLKMEIVDSNLVLQQAQNNSQQGQDNRNTTGKCPDLWATPSTILGSMYADQNPEKRNSPSLATQAVGKLWATPQAWDHVEIIRKPEDRSNAANMGGCSNLREQVVNWPTPNASDPNQGGTTQGQRKSPNLSIVAVNWGTPTARDHKSGRGLKERTYKELTAMVERQQLGRLSPMWVEQMMGLPIGWTGCDYLETELSPPPQNLPSEHSTTN